MAAIDTSRTVFGSASVAMRPGVWISAIASALTTWNDARQTRNALCALTDRELEDIGLVRGDIDDVANRGY